MKKINLVLLFVLSFYGAVAQEEYSSQMYVKSASEFIFSLGSVDAIGPANEPIDVNPILRFTAFFHLQEQIHYDFNKNIGIFTGLGIRNVGMINDLNDSVKVKQRAYSLGVPLAVKIGNVKKGNYVSLGAEAELFFHYKQKVFYDDEKDKRSEWFSDKINLFNPSVFLDLNSSRGGYVRFKYYLIDFLVEDKQNIKLYGQPYAYKPEKSALFYVAIGTTIKVKSRSKYKANSEKVDTAFKTN